MKNKSFILILTLIITFFCVYFLTFTYKSRAINDQAIAYATNDSGQVDLVKKQFYIDSLWTKKVYSFLWAEYTLEEVKSKEINLGLDLQGGMHVVLEVAPDGLVMALAGKSADEKLKEVLKKANLAQRESQDSYSSLFYTEFKKSYPNTKLNQIFSNSANKGSISFETTDEEILKIIDKEIESAVERSQTILRSRIDKFGVSQPNIQHLKGTNRIQVELAGIDNPGRVRTLLQGVAKLEFLEVVRPVTFYNSLIEYNKFLYNKEQLEAKSTSDSSSEGMSDLFASETADSTTEKSTESSDLNDLFGGESDSASATTDSTNTTKDSAALAADSAKKPMEISKIFSKIIIFPNQTEFGALQLMVMVEKKDIKEVMSYMAQEKIKPFFPPNTEVMPSNQTTALTDGREVYYLHAVSRLRGGKAEVTGDVVTNAMEDIDDKGRGWQISLSMNSKGAEAWKRLTTKLSADATNDPRSLAIVLDNVVYSAPHVPYPITGGRTSITGDFSKDEARALASVLKAGSLPAPLRIVEETVVGPSMGKEAISQGLLSTLAGLALVVVFMIVYYNKGGAVADIAMFVNIFFIIGLLAQFGFALTLPGIAGIVLTIGMAIDANVLIFERIKEELDLGKSHLKAIEEGFDKAFWTIFDSNLTTLIVGLILAYFGTGPVKGFAVTLVIGIGCSFFTAVFVGRIVVDYLARKNEGRNLKFDTVLSKGFMKNANFDFVKNRKKAYAFSAIVILLGVGATIANGGMNLGLDFKGGRAYVLNFDEAVPSDEVKALVKSKVGDASVEAKVYGAPNRLKISTSYLVEEESEEADAQAQATILNSLEKYKNLNPTILSSSKVGATIADDIKFTSFQSLSIAIFLIFLYIVLRFRKWQFGMGATIALIHDVLVVISMFSIARLLGISYEIDQIFIAAILTIVGYSINDTVVVFDRVREYMTEKPSADNGETFNKAINSTLSRTLMTSLTTLIVVVVLFIFGGEALRGFSFALLVGIVFGTYSSIFIATPIVLDTAISKKDKK